MSDWSRTRTRELLFGVRMSVRYHNLRRSHFMAWNKRFKYLTALSGLGVVTNVLASGPSQLSIAFGVVVAFAQYYDLVVGLESKSYQHDEMAKQFIALEDKISNALSNGQVTDQVFSDLTSERLTIERSEGHTLLWLAVEARNAQIFAQIGKKSPEMIHIPFFQRLFINYFDLVRLKAQ